MNYTIQYSDNLPDWVGGSISSVGVKATGELTFQITYIGA